MEMYIDEMIDVCKMMLVALDENSTVKDLECCINEKVLLIQKRRYVVDYKEFTFTFQPKIPEYTFKLQTKNEYIDALIKCLKKLLKDFRKFIED